ncbi:MULTISPECIES: SapB/AmfS family lanthipeptide [Streptomyces]|nr:MULTISPECIES: SapB/AmfS family lanthipeptide [Streptomyces]ARZ70360.1 AmfS protein [Streptomyces albireticuli]MCD9141959.1 SapB/AmfS family lanthipeptide [Streptomyces albireticuli]MCD9163097.1 SapB/AmfS family lanthipeptide [Streptomyces albireticuli]MCD9190133.1 SapB/AmfS family lanthipeptide [Streptomyces albireticuli]UQI43896.1 SapB/AmfS family lanthipeptide [Streptomyces sp. HU2014]
MALLDLQNMDSEEYGGGHGGGGSNVSLLLCWSTASVALCL